MTEPLPAQGAAIDIHATPEAIWRALTESGFTTRYYYGNTVESDWRPGSSYRYRDAGEVSIEGEVLEADPPHRLVTTFTACWDAAARAEGASRVTWEIRDSDEPGVSRLVVTHDRLEGRPATWHEVSEGWPFIIGGLRSVLEAGQGTTE